MPEEVVRNTSFSDGIAMKYQFNQSINQESIKTRAQTRQTWVESGAHSAHLVFLELLLDHLNIVRHWRLL